MTVRHEHPERYEPRPTWVDLGLWWLRSKGRRLAYFASPLAMPPEGAYDASDLENRPGALANYGSPIYDACCPGCGGLVAQLDPKRATITGEPGAGFQTGLTCAEPIWFTACCGWYGHLRQGVWKGRVIAPPRQPAERR